MKQDVRPVHEHSVITLVCQVWEKHLFFFLSRKVFTFFLSSYAFTSMIGNATWPSFFSNVKPPKSYFWVLQTVTWLSHFTFCFVAYLSSLRLIRHSDRCFSFHFYYCLPLSTARCRNYMLDIFCYFTEVERFFLTAWHESSCSSTATDITLGLT